MIAKSTTNAAGTSIRITKPTRFDVFTVFVVPTCILLVKAGVLSSVAVLERGSKKDLVVIAAGPNLYALADAEIGPAWSAILPRSNLGRLGSWLDANPVVHSRADALLAAEVSLRRLD